MFLGYTEPLRASVAQGIEHRSPKAGVVRSNRIGCTIFYSYKDYYVAKSILRDVFCCPAPLLRFIWGRKYDSIRGGSVAEWLKAHDSKSCGQQCLGGSNPLASAIF